MVVCVVACECVCLLRVRERVCPRVSVVGLCVGRLVCWCVGVLVDWLIGRLVGWLVGLVVLLCV